jgi:hypothetical protein
MATNIGKIIEAAGFVAMPVLSVLAGAIWDFKLKDGTRTRASFIAIAGVISSLLFSYLVWKGPSPSLILTPSDCILD